MLLNDCKVERTMLGGGWWVGGERGHGFVFLGVAGVVVGLVVVVVVGWVEKMVGANDGFIGIRNEKRGVPLQGKKDKR